MGEKRTGLVTDSRAALEEDAVNKIAQLVLEIRNLAHRGWEDGPNAEFLFREIGKKAQKIGELSEKGSSSLKPLLSAIQKGIVEFGYVRGARILYFRETHKIFPVELDSSGIPVLTEEIIEALEAAK